MTMADQAIKTGEAKHPSILTQFVRAIFLLRESPVGMVGAGICVFWVLVAIFAPLLAPYDPLATMQPMAFPGAAYARG